MTAHNKLFLIPLGFFTLLQLIFISQVDSLEYDEAIYMDVARNISQTGVAWRSMGNNLLYAEHTSLYQHLLGFLTIFIGENIFLFRLLTICLAVCCLFLTYLLVLKLTQNRFNSLLATFLLAVNPFFNLYAYFIREEMLMCLFLLGSAYSFWHYQQKGISKYLVATAFLFAGAILTKEISLIFGCVLGLTIFFRPVSWLQKLKESFIFITPAGVGLCLWGVWVSWHAPLLLQAILTRWFASASPAGGQSDLRMGLAVGQWGKILSLEVYSLGFMTAGLLAFLLAIWQRKKITPFFGLCGGYVATALLFSFLFTLKEPRHLIATIPFAAITIGLIPNFDALNAQLQKSRIELWATAGLFTLLLSQSSLWQLPFVGQPPYPSWNYRVAYRLFVEPPYYRALRSAGLYINEHLPPEAKISVIHQVTVVGYYADRNYIGIYGSSYSEVFTILDQTEYLVYDAPAFLHLSPTEIEQVNQYINQHFNVLETIQDEYRPVIIYQHK